MLDVMINSYLLYLIYVIGQHIFYNALVLEDIHRFTISEVYVASGSRTEQSSFWTQNANHISGISSTMFIIRLGENTQRCKVVKIGESVFWQTYRAGRKEA